VVSYHFLAAGPVLGNFHQVSISMGAFNRFEFGYTGSLHQEGSTAGLNTLWSGGFNVFHAKANLLRERRVVIPALSVGVVARTGVRNVGGVIQGKDTHNQDFYAVATKTFTRNSQAATNVQCGVQGDQRISSRLGGERPWLLWPSVRGGWICV
jgi:hypothetical protein